MMRTHTLSIARQPPRATKWTAKAAILESEIGWPNEKRDWQGGAML